jgi:hypothetical protein
MEAWVISLSNANSACVPRIADRQDCAFRSVPIGLRKGLTHVSRRTDCQPVVPGWTDSQRVLNRGAATTSHERSGRGGETTMRRPRARRFGIIDCMGIVAATALAVALARYHRSSTDTPAHRCGVGLGRAGARPEVAARAVVARSARPDPRCKLAGRRGRASDRTSFGGVLVREISVSSFFGQY